MDGWQTFSEHYCNEPSHYSRVSQEYADYCAKADRKAPLLGNIPIKKLVEALEEIVLKELSPTEHDGTA
tara:strand:- start:11711 stop:11917 length:207 start_codon:yes stop_codon:yes gene_type:complete